MRIYVTGFRMDLIRFYTDSIYDLCNLPKLNVLSCYFGLFTV